MAPPAFRLAAVASAAVVIVAGSLSPAGAYPRPGRTQKLTVAHDGGAPDRGAGSSAISADGRFVAFESWSSNLVPGDTNEWQDIFVADTLTGETERVNVSSDGSQAEGISSNPDISADGRYVVFASNAPNLAPDQESPEPEVYLHDRVTGETVRVVEAAGGGEPNGSTHIPTISDDGRFVAFQSYATDLLSEQPPCELGSCTNNAYVIDRQTGEIEQASQGWDGSAPNGQSRASAISGDGRFVAFLSDASNIVPDDTNFAQDVFLYDRKNHFARRVSINSEGFEANGPSYAPGISGDGRYTTFPSVASNLVPGDTNGMEDVFVYDRLTNSSERVSLSSRGAEVEDFTEVAALSADGRYVTFMSWASTLVDGDTNECVGTIFEDVWNCADIFVHDRATRSTQRVSLSSSGDQGNDDSAWPEISADGRRVVFMSAASNLVDGDENPYGDIYVRDRGPELGVGELRVDRHGDEAEVSGWATFAGRAISTASDHPADSSDFGFTGSELTGASLIVRPEDDDLLVRIELAYLPGYQGMIPASTPGEVYGLELGIGDARYEVRAERMRTADPASAEPLYGLYRCDPSCEKVRALAGTMGGYGDEVTISVPPSALGLAEGDSITGLRAFAAIGRPDSPALVVLDDVALPDASMTEARIELGVAPPGTPPGEVRYDARAEMTDGTFSARIHSNSLPVGAYRVWVRACVGAECGPARSA